MVGNTHTTTEENRDEDVLERPAGHERTPADEREPYPGDLSVTRKEAFESIVEELERWGKTDVVVETAAPHYPNHPNRPHQHAKPNDVGVVAYYRDPARRAEERAAISSDRWETLGENARALALWVRRVRLADRCEVETRRDIEEVAELPPAEEDVEAIAAPPASSEDVDPYEVLDVSPNASDKVVESAFRAKVNGEGKHPDKGGSTEEFEQLVDAREDIING